MVEPEVKNNNDSNLMSDAKFYESYARYKDDEQRYETWNEAVERVMNMHKIKYKQELKDKPELIDLFSIAEEAYKNKELLGAQRALQFGGEQLLKKHAKMYNCFSVDTSFVTSNGMKKFSNFNDGDKINVLTHKGNWKNAVVVNYGKQQLYNITFSKSGQTTIVKATKNHRWLLKDEVETTFLKVGDVIMREPSVFEDFTWDTASAAEKIYWCYGMVFGDGTVTTNKYSLIRLCKNASKFEKRFNECGFNSSSNSSLQGDCFVYTGTYLKTAPNPRVDSPELIRAFVSGYLQADGEKAKNKTGKKYNSIQATGEKYINFIRECFPIAGVHITSEKDLTGQVTNLGTRPYTIKFIIRDYPGGKSASYMRVEDISPASVEEVWCLEVEDDHSFILAKGIVTGNCTATYCDRPDFFKEAFWLMLCGCGVGFSVQKQHIAKLPKIQQRTKQAKTFIVQDSIEGWADALDALLKSFFDYDSEWKGRKVYFDLINIRPKGAKISGGFKAPGPEPLRKALDKIENLLHNEILAERTTIKPIVAYDIMMYVADAVISGGVRRAATICLFSHDDEEMIKAKTGNWFIANPQRGRSNNSVVLLREKTTKDEFAKIMESVKHSGEPGFVFTDNLDILFNPCITKDASIMTSEGARTVESLIGKPFKVLVDGYTFNTTEKGFFKTGYKEVFKLTLKDGKNLKLTANHKVNTLRGWVEAKDLTPDDSVILHKHKNYRWGSNNTSDKEIGWLLGNLVGDGTFNKTSAILRYWGKETYLADIARKYLTKHCTTYRAFNGANDKAIISIGSTKLALIARGYGITSKSKNANHILEETSSNFYIGYIRGLFDADGCVVGNTKKGISVRLTQNNLDILEQVQRMLLRLSINSKIYKNRRADGYYSLPDGTGDKKDYFCKSVHDLVISRSSLELYRTIIGFECLAKKELLDKLLASYKRPLYKDAYCSKIHSLEYKGIEEVYDVTVPEIHAFDANGLYVHNCVEVGLYAYNKKMESGCQFCNLTEVNGGKSTTPEIFYEQCKAAAILGTLQAGYTDFKYTTEVTREIVEREALIGVGITGWMNNPDVLFNKEVQKKGAEIVKKWNKITAKLIGINQAARTTVVKPSGNASVLLGTASGIHGEHSPRYIRNVQMNKQTEVAKLFAEVNPSMTEDSVWGDTDYVISFPITPKAGSIYKKDLLGVKQLAYVKNAQDNWIMEGTNKHLCVKPFLHHNVSNTITVDDWDEVTEYIYENKNSFCGVSLLSAAGDKAYPQAPFTEVLTQEDIVKQYGEKALFTSALIEAGLLAFNKDLWTAINTAIGEGEDLSDEHSNLTKRDFVRRFNKFAKHFESKQECGNCLKDVYNLHKWWKIENTAKPINWITDLSKKDFIDINTIASQGCSGGNCELEF